MEGRFVICDVDVLQQREARHLEQLNYEPDNLDSRLGLAWCLFMRALHQAGQASMLATIKSMVPQQDLDALSVELASADKDAYGLLKHSLHETFTVMRLDLHKDANEDIARLHALVRLSGAEQAFKEAEEEAVCLVASLVRDVQATESEENPPLPSTSDGPSL